jgi:hypothetical protein
MKITNWKLNIVLNLLLLVIGILLMCRMISFITYSHISIVGAVFIGYSIYGIFINVKTGLIEKNEYLLIQ